MVGAGASRKDRGATHRAFIANVLVVMRNETRALITRVVKLRLVEEVASKFPPPRGDRCDPF